MFRNVIDIPNLLNRPSHSAAGLSDESEKDLPLIVRRNIALQTKAETDLFERARNIYSRGRRRYGRRPTGII